MKFTRGGDPYKKLRLGSHKPIDISYERRKKSAIKIIINGFYGTIPSYLTKTSKNLHVNTADSVGSLTKINKTICISGDKISDGAKTNPDRSLHLHPGGIRG